MSSHTTETRRGRRDGVRDLEALRVRCRIDSLSGCWIWAGGRNDKGAPVIRIPAGVLRESAVIMAPRRAGWLLAGRSIKPGEVVMRTLACESDQCVNPAHSAAGLRADVNRTAGKRGSYSTPERLAHLTKARMKSAIDPQLVSVAEDAFTSGATVREAAERAGIDRETARRIRNGDHIHQAGGVMRAASVFAWRPAA